MSFQQWTTTTMIYTRYSQNDVNKRANSRESINSNRIKKEKCVRIEDNFDLEMHDIVSSYNNNVPPMTSNDEKEYPYKLNPAQVKWLIFTLLFHFYYNYIHKQSII